MKKTMKKYLKIAASFTVVLSIFACGKETPLAPNQLQQKENLQKTTEQITFLTSKTKSLNKIFDVSRLVTVAGGGTIEVGDFETGISRITFNPGDVKSNVNVGFWWDSNNFQAEFTPEGITFNNPVRIRLSYKDADLSGIDENNLKIWYYDENNNIWELIGQTVNKTEKYVEGTTTHFSRYAIGSE